MDKDPSLARIMFDLPQRDVPELLAYLGSFALKHDVAIRMVAAPPETDQPSLIVDNSIYNPEFTVLLQTAEEGEPVPVVTKQLLADFGRRQGKVGVAERLINQLGYAVDDNPGLKDMLYGSDNAHGYFRAAGIKVGYIKYLQQLLNNGNLDVRNVGTQSLKLLNEYCSELFLEETPN